MKRLTISCYALAAVATLQSGASGSIIELARYTFVNGSQVSVDTDSNTTAGSYVATDLGLTGTLLNSGISTGVSPAFDGAAYMRGLVMPLATTTQSNITPGPGGNASFHEFTLAVDGLPSGQALNLTDIAYSRRADTGSRGWVEVYSDVTGFTVADRLVQSFSFSTTFVPQSFSLASFAPLSGLRNGDSVNFRLYFSSTNVTASNNVQRVDNLVLSGELVDSPVPEPAAHTLLLVLGATAIGALLPRGRKALQVATVR